MSLRLSRKAMLYYTNRHRNKNTLCVTSDIDNTCNTMVVAVVVVVDEYDVAVVVSTVVVAVVVDDEYVVVVVDDVIIDIFLIL